MDFLSLESVKYQSPAWQLKLELFCSKNASVFNLRSLGEGKAQFINRITHTLDLEVKQLSNDTAWNLVKSLCDALRICMREDFEIDEAISDQTFQNILRIVAYFPLNRETVEVWETVEMALRCLTNAMHVIPRSVPVFLDNGGIEVLFAVLSGHDPSAMLTSEPLDVKRPLNVTYFTIRLLYMLSSQRIDLNHRLRERDHIAVLVECLVATVQGEPRWPPFPLGHHRADQFKELCKLLHSIDLFSSLKTAIDSNEPSASIQTASSFELSALESSLVDVIAGADPSAEMLDCRQYVFQLCMLAPSSSGLADRVLATPRCIENILATLFHVLVVGAESSDSSDSASDTLTAKLAPILVVLIKLTSSCAGCRSAIHAQLFPAGSSESQSCAMESAVEEVDSLAPSDAPPDSLRGLLIAHMTSTDTTLKRLTSELLFEVCNSDTEEFVKRTGFGNAVALLQGKGLLG